MSKPGFGQIELGVYTPKPVSEAFDRAVTAVADVRFEAIFGEALRKALAAVEKTAVPCTVRALTSRRLHTMEWAPGRNLSDIHETTTDRQEVLELSSRPRPRPRSRCARERSRP